MPATLFILIFDMIVMKKVVKAILFVLILAVLFASVVILIPDQFGESYQRAIVRQYNWLKSLEENKIVFIGSSSLAFGFDLELMEELTQMPCVMLGNHYGDGLCFQMEMSKENLKPGDTVVIEYMNYNMDSGEGELLLTAAGKNYGMYRFITKTMRAAVAKAYPAYIRKSFDYWRNGGYHPELPYRIDAFDERGNMIYDRPDCWIPDPYTEELQAIYHEADFYAYKKNMDQVFIQYLNDYVQYCEEAGVKVYFTVPAFYDKAIDCQPENIVEFQNYLSDALDAPLISDYNDYIFSRDYIFDTINHCNTAGAERRTRQLYEDIKEYLS